MKYFIANWKAHKNLDQALDWIQYFKTNYTPVIKKHLEDEKIKIIICPPSPFLITVKDAFKQMQGIYVGVQDISRYPEGSYTGELSAQTITSIATYTLIGHSERRRYFHEDINVLTDKYNRALESGIMPIYCISSSQDRIPPHAQMVAYEPVESIGTGNNASVHDIMRIKSELSLQNDTLFLYGGSVTPKNIAEYLSHPAINGFLIGTASLDPSEFIRLVEATI